MWLYVQGTRCLFLDFGFNLALVERSCMALIGPTCPLAPVIAAMRSSWHASSSHGGT